MAAPLLLAAARTLTTGAGRGALLKGAAKKIAKDKLLGGDKDKKDVKKLPPGEDETEKSSAIVKFDRKSVSLVPYKPSIESKTISKDKLLGGEKKTDKGKRATSKLLISVYKNLELIKKYLKDKKKSDEKKSEQSKKEAEVDKKKKREDELEKKKDSKSKMKIPSVPGMSFFDSIINFFSNVLIGSLLSLLLANKGIILKALEDIGKGLTNTWNLLRLGIITVSNTAKGLIKSVANLGSKLFKNKTTQNLLKKLGGGIKNVFSKLGQSVVNKIKSIASMSGGNILQKGAQKAAQAALSGGRAVGGMLQNKAVQRFGQKGAKYLGKLSGVFKRIPVIGALIGIGIDLALGERLDNAVAGAAGASLGAAVGGAIGTGVLPIPFVGTAVGGIVGAAIGDWVGKEIWKNISGQMKDITPEDEQQQRTYQPPQLYGGRDAFTPLGSGGGSLKNMRDQDWSDLAYIVSGEAARGTDDEYGVAAAVLNRVADPKWPNTIMGVGTQSGQFEAVYKGLAKRDPALANKLKQNQGKIVEALKLLNGRTDFKGQSQLKNRGSGDPMFHPRGNFYHYSSQRAITDPAPKNPPQHWKKFINGNGSWQSSSQPVQAPQIAQSQPTESGEFDYRSPTLSMQQASLSTQPSSAPSQRSQGLDQQAFYEKSGQFIPIPIPMGGGQPNVIPMGGDSGSGMFLPMGISKQQALNSYYNSQLMGFLYKQG